MLKLRELDVTNKRVLMRVDFNVPVQAGEITDDTRIRATLPTIQYLIDKGAKLILMSHLGRPKGERKPEYSLLPVAARLSRLLGKPVIFSSNCIGDEPESKASRLEPGDVLLLENLRFHKGETKNDPEFAAGLAKLGEIYVNDAFAVSHRAHASVVGVPKLMKVKAPGFLLEKEIEAFEKVLKNPDRPFHAVMGGAKISDKIEVIHNLLDKVDKLFVGGGMSFTFFRAMGYETGDSIVEEDKVGLAEELLNKYGDKIALPVDIVVADDVEQPTKTEVIDPKAGIPKGVKGVDIGPATCDRWGKELMSAKTIVWNGPVGVFEHKPFDEGSKAIAQVLVKVTEMGGTTVVGGGDTVAFVNQTGIGDKLTHVSTGGGASLEYLAGYELPGIKALSE